MAEPEYRAVIFDFGGVLTTRIEDAVVAFARREGLVAGRLRTG